MHDDAGDNEGHAPQAGVARARDVARRYADEIRGRLGAHVRSVRLFGSAARGDWSAGSDIDVLVLLRSLREADTTWLARRAFELGVLEQGTVLQPIFMAETDFDLMKRRERRFALEVEREGVLL